MASVTEKIRMIRDTRKKASSRKSSNFEEYRPRYAEVFCEVKELGGDATLIELTDWVATKTRETGRLPHPDIVIDEAVRICNERGIVIRDGSPL